MKLFKTIGCSALFAATVLGTAATVNATPDGDQLIKWARDSYQATCQVFDENLTGDLNNDIPVVIGVVEAVANHYGISEDDAVEVVETQAILYCPEHEDNLQAIGNWARQQPQTPSESETPVLKRAV